jgi:hypothetical protein
MHKYWKPMSGASFEAVVVRTYTDTRCCYHSILPYLKYTTTRQHHSLLIVMYNQHAHVQHDSAIRQMLYIPADDMLNSNHSF